MSDSSLCLVPYSTTINGLSLTTAIVLNSLLLQPLLIHTGVGPIPTMDQFVQANLPVDASHPVLIGSRNARTAKQDVHLLEREPFRLGNKEPLEMYSLALGITVMVN